MEDRRTTIGEGTIITGDIRGEEDIVIFGRIEGRIDLSATLFIEAPSFVKGELHVNHAVVIGSVIGDIHASDCIEVAPSGRVIGNLFTPRLVIADGGAVKGNITMKPAEGKQEAHPAERPAPAAFKSPVQSQKRLTLTTAKNSDIVSLKKIQLHDDRKKFGFGTKPESIPRKSEFKAKITPETVQPPLPQETSAVEETKIEE